MSCITIDVTKEDIKRAKQGGFYCPIARAMKRAVPRRLLHVDYAYTDIAVAPGSQISLRRVLPDKAVKFAQSFDNPGCYEAPEPFSFVLSIPEAVKNT